MFSILIQSFAIVLENDNWMPGGVFVHLVIATSVSVSSESCKVRTIHSIELQPLLIP